MVNILWRWNGRWFWRDIHWTWWSGDAFQWFNDYKAIIGANWRAMCFGETTMGVNGMTIDFNGNQPSVIRSIGNEPSVSSFNCCLQNWTLWTLQPNIVIWKMLGSRPNIKRVVVTWTGGEDEGRGGGFNLLSHYCIKDMTSSPFLFKYSFPGNLALLLQ